MICNHYCFNDNFDYQPYVCNKCHNFSMTGMDLSDFFVLNVKDVETDFTINYNTWEFSTGLILYVFTQNSDIFFLLCTEEKIGLSRLYFHYIITKSL